MKRRIPQFSEAKWLIAIALAWVWLIGPGVIEGMIFPAAEPMTLTQTELRENGIAIWGRSARLRPSCSFRSIKWYSGERNGISVPVKIDTGPPIVRKEGDFSFGPLVVDIWPPSALLNYSYADVYHRCRIGPIELPWLTKSRFWR